MKLYSYHRSSAAYRVRIALNLKGLDYAYVPVNLLKGEQKGGAYLARNPLGLVPALESDDGDLLTQSVAILEWLEESAPAPALLPEDPALWRSLQGPDMPVRAVVRASYEVSETGDARELEVEAEGDASSALAGRLRRLLAESHYRPALRDGVGFSATITGRR